jgi:hypothetical protein
MDSVLCSAKVPKALVLGIPRTKNLLFTSSKRSKNLVTASRRRDSLLPFDRRCGMPVGQSKSISLVI